MNLEEFGPDAKDEMSPADYIQYCLDRYYEYRTLAMDPTINAQATKLYSEKASDYYAQAQEAMDEIEPDNTDHLSDEDKALPNVSLADQENELNNENTNEMFTKQSRQYDQWADDNDRLKIIKAAQAAELSDKDKAMIDKYEDEEKEQEDSEMNKIDAAMYRESIDLERWNKLAGLDK
jgi:transposase